VDDPYLLPGTTVLRNRRGITDGAELAEAEAYYVEARLAGIEEAGYARTFRADHLSAIHRWLFADLFDWAGEHQTRDYTKDGTQFWPAESLGRRLDKVLDGLVRSSPLLTGSVDDETFVVGLSWLYLDLNHLHPFREGNGRAQRRFLDDVAAVSGRLLDWSLLDRRTNDHACAVATQSQSPTPLRAVLEPLVFPLTDERAPATRDIDVFREARTAQRWTHVPPSEADPDLVLRAIEAGLELTALSERTAEVADLRRGYVRQLHDGGRSLDWIASRLGVSKSAVQQILRRSHGPGGR
jgi:cell filamentation protein